MVQKIVYKIFISWLVKDQELHLNDNSEGYDVTYDGSEVHGEMVRGKKEQCKTLGPAYGWARWFATCDRVWCESEYFAMGAFGPLISKHWGEMEVEFDVNVNKMWPPLR